MATRTVVVSPRGVGPQFLDHPDGELSRRGRVIAWLLAGALLLTGAATLTASGITPITGEQTTARQTTAGQTTSGQTSGGMSGTDAAAGFTTTRDGSDANAANATVANDTIVAEWDGPTTHVDWRGMQYTTVQASFVGDRVASPGDLVQRTLTIENAGPGGAVLAVSLRANQEIPALAANPDLAKDVDLFWDVAGITGNEVFDTLLTDTEHTIAEARVDQGETVQMTVGFTMPAEVTTSQSAGGESTLLTFDVLVRMTGDSTSEVLGTEVEPESGSLAITGSQLAGIALVVVGLVLAGWLLLAIARSRPRCDDCGVRVNRADGWTVHHRDHGLREVHCAQCREPAHHDTAELSFQ